jgi:hypothetical protein
MPAQQHAHFFGRAGGHHLVDGLERGQIAHLNAHAGRHTQGLQHGGQIHRRDQRLRLGQRHQVVDIGRVTPLQRCELGRRDFGFHGQHRAGASIGFGGRQTGALQHAADVGQVQVAHTLAFGLGVLIGRERLLPCHEQEQVGLAVFQVSAHEGIDQRRHTVGQLQPGRQLTQRCCRARQAERVDPVQVGLQGLQPQIVQALQIHGRTPIVADLLAR